MFSCGDIKNIGFPFWGENRPNGCGHPQLHLTCQNNKSSYITINEVKYQVLEANPDEHTLRITREDYLQQGLCPSKLVNTTLDTEVLVYATSDYKNLTLFYGCDASISNAFPSLPCLPNGASDEHVYPWLGGSIGFPPALSCNTSVVVPLSYQLSTIEISDFNKTQGAISDGFVVRWMVGVEECDKCQKSGGVCGYNLTSNQPTCYCSDPSCSDLVPDATQEPPPPGMSIKIIANCIFYSL